jgi:hypothetical protein
VFKRKAGGGLLNMAQLKKALAMGRFTDKIGKPLP